MAASPGRPSSRAPFLRGLRATVAGLAALVVALVLVAPLAAADPAPGTYSGKGFDACSAPTQDLMTAWVTASPYRAMGIYTSGINRACTQPQLTASWVSAQQAAGWHLVPIHMGPQPYCTTSNKKYRFTAADAAASGRTSADVAVDAATALGLGPETTIFLDVEAYSTTDATCRKAVRDYQSAWTARLHELKFLSGFYSSLGSGVADQVASYNSPTWVRPDYLWFARYDGVATVSNPAIPDSYWPRRRIKQYQNPALTGGPETWGGYSLSVDRDQLDLRAVPPTPFGDFDGNGWSDLLARGTTSGALRLFAGDGNRFGTITTLSTGWNAMSAITRFGDFDKDDWEDVIARESATGFLWVYRGNGSGFSGRFRVGSNGWNGMREITPLGDLDGDGFDDLVAVQRSNGCLYLYPGRGDVLARRTSLGCGWNAMSELAGVGDFNRDGRVDLVARTTATGDLWLYPGTTAGRLGPRSRIGTGWGTMRDLTGVGDIDRDGFTDLVAVQTATGDLYRYPGRGTSLGTRLRIGSGWTATRPLL